MILNAGARFRCPFSTSGHAEPRRPRQLVAVALRAGAVLDAVIAGDDAGAERASTILTSGAGPDIDAVLASRHKLPSVSAAPTPIKRPLTTVR